MSERRSLIEGIKSRAAVKSSEEEFVYGEKARPASAPPQHTNGEVKEAKPQPVSPVNRIPLTTRVRAEIAAGLKRASLERQLSGLYPNTLQDIVEEALEPWLHKHGYLP